MNWSPKIILGDFGEDFGRQQLCHVAALKCLDVLEMMGGFSGTPQPGLPKSLYLDGGLLEIIPWFDKRREPFHQISSVINDPKRIYIAGYPQ